MQQFWLVFWRPVASLRASFFIRIKFDESDGAKVPFWDVGELDVVWVGLVCCCLIFCLHTLLMCLQALSWERCLTRSIICCLGSLFRPKGKRCRWLSIHKAWSLFVTNLQKSLWWGNLFFGVAQVANVLGDAFGHWTVSSAMKLWRTKSLGVHFACINAVKEHSFSFPPSPYFISSGRKNS